MKENEEKTLQNLTVKTRNIIFKKKKQISKIINFKSY